MTRRASELQIMRPGALLAYLRSQRPIEPEPIHRSTVGIGRR
jgi:hypothetical protein